MGRACSDGDMTTMKTTQNLSKFTMNSTVGRVCQSGWKVFVHPEGSGGKPQGGGSCSCWFFAYTSQSLNTCACTHCQGSRLDQGKPLPVLSLICMGRALPTLHMSEALGPWHGCAHVNNTHSFRTSSPFDTWTLGCVSSHTPGG